MSVVLQFALLGLGAGALFAGLALSTVVTYRGSGTVNMAAGSMAGIAAYVFYGLRTAGYLWLPPIPFAPSRVHLGAPWATVPAFAVTLGVCTLMGVLFELLVIRPLRNAPQLARLLASLGLLLTVEAMIVLRFGSTGQIAPAVLSERFVDFLGVSVPEGRLVLAGIVLVATAGLVGLYRFSRFGLATRAAAENEVTARLAGLSPNRLSLVNTVLATLLAGTLGVLVAPLTQLDPTTIPLAVVPALGAALLARFTGFGTAALAGLLLGVIQSLLIYLQSKSWFPTSAGGAPLPGVDDLVFFLIILVATLWRGGRLPVRGALVEKRLPAVPVAQRMIRPALLWLGLILVAALVFPFDFRQALANTLIGVVVCLSLVVITGFVGQISIVQVALAGVAGFVMQKVAAHAGIGFPLGPLIGIASATGFGVVTAVSALRVRGVSLAIVTLAGAVALDNFGFSNTGWGGGASGSPVGSPHLLGLDLGPSASFPLGAGGVPSPVFVFACGAVTIAVALLVMSLRRSNLGQRMLAVRSNEPAAAAAGISVRGVKLTAFALSSAIAGTAGCLYGYSLGSVTTDQFGIVIALTFVAYAYIGGITTVTGAVIGGLGVTEGLISHVMTKWLGIAIQYQLLVGGLLLVFTIVTNPGGLAASGGAPPGYPWLRDRVRARRLRAAAPLNRPAASLPAVAAPIAGASGERVLSGPAGTERGAGERGA